MDRSQVIHVRHPLHLVFNQAAVEGGHVCRHARHDLGSHKNIDFIPFPAAIPTNLEQKVRKGFETFAAALACHLASLFIKDVPFQRKQVRRVSCSK